MEYLAHSAYKHSNNLKKVRSAVTKHYINSITVGMIIITLVFKIAIENSPYNVRIFYYTLVSVYCLGVPILMSIVMDIEVFMRAVFLYIANKHIIRIVSMHEAGHALVRELLFPGGNGLTVICKGFRSCLYIARQNCYIDDIIGINHFDSFWIPVYNESNKEKEQMIQRIYYNLRVALAGIVAEKIDFDTEDIYYQIINAINTDNEEFISDFEPISKGVAALAAALKKSEETIVYMMIDDVKNILLEHKDILNKINYILLRRGRIKGKKIKKIVKRYLKNKNLSAMKYSKRIAARVYIYNLLRKNPSIKLLMDMIVEFYNEIKELKHALTQNFK